MTERLVSHFAAFGATVARRLPLYRRLSLAAADDPAVADRLLLAGPQQRRPTLLLAAVHDVLLAGADDPLAAWYPSVTAEPRPVGSGADDPWPHFRRLALDDPGVAERLRTRSTQTNEVGRCATTLLALADVDAPIRLVEVGASAGLNLLLDRYRIDYRWPDGTAYGIGDSTVTLACEIRGPNEPPVPRRMIDIRERVGLDRTPVDLTDPDRSRWLLACSWPDQPERIERLRAALTLGLSDPPTVLTGDAVHDVAGLVEPTPSDLLPVVVSTWVMAYLTADDQRRFLAGLDRVGEQRDLTLILAEQPDQVPGLPIPAGPDRADRTGDQATALVRIDWRDGRRRVRRVADQHPHGTWVRWSA